LAHFLAQRGYQVVGADVAPNAIRLAQENPMFRRGKAPEFFVADSESLQFELAVFAIVGLKRFSGLTVLRK
jgi:hypothetical protein